jgi:adenosine/AMP kinase
MAVAVGMDVAVGEVVGARVLVALGTKVALAVGEASGSAPPAQPTRLIKIKSEHTNCRMGSFNLIRKLGGIHILMVCGREAYPKGCEAPNHQNEVLP